MAKIRIPYRLADLNPKAQPAFEALTTLLTEAHRTGRTEHHLRPFEGFRPLEAQQAALDRGASKAKPWQSAHQYGLAVDFVPWSEGLGWYWPSADHPDWDVLGEIAINRGLIYPIKWDRAHVEHPIWSAIKRHVV